MGFTRDEAQSSLRLSIGWGTTEDEVRRFVEILVQVVERLRNLEKQFTFPANSGMTGASLNL